MAVSRLGLFGVASRLGPVWARGRWPSPGSGLASWALAFAWSGLGSWALALLECGVLVVLSAGYPLESHTRRASRGRGAGPSRGRGRALAEAGGGPQPRPGAGPSRGRVERGPAEAGAGVQLDWTSSSPGAARAASRNSRISRSASAAPASRPARIHFRVD